MATRTDKSFERVQSFTQTYEIDDKRTITVSWLLAQLKQACVSNGDSEGIVSWTVPVFLTDEPMSSRTVWTSLYENDVTTHRLRNASTEHIFTFVEALTFPL